MKRSTPHRGAGTAWMVLLMAGPVLGALAAMFALAAKMGLIKP